MNLPLQITYRDVTPSPALESVIRERAAKLDHFAQRITSCRVVVEAPHRHSNKADFHVRIDITVPGAEEIVVSREPSSSAADPYVAVREAFDAATRQLQDLERRRQPS